MRWIARSVMTAAMLLLTACSPRSAAPGEYFEEVTDATGINYTQFNGYDCFDPVICGPDFMAGGVAAGDYDSDGNIDLLVTRLNDYPILYRNRGDGTFEDRTKDAGLLEGPKLTRSNGAAWADLENKGCPDLIITALRDRRNYLYSNDCRGRLTEVGIERGFAHQREEESVYGFGIGVGDYDRDGFLDILTGEWRYDAIYPGAPSNARLFRNLGARRPGFFEDQTEQAGLTISVTGGWLPGHFAFSPVFADLDRDGYQDIYIGADFNRGQLLWNNRDGTFTDTTRDARVDSDENGMGVAIADFDADGLPDIFVSSIYQTGSACGDKILDREFCALWGESGNRLYRNGGDRRFEDWTDRAGVRDGGWGWGSMPLDFQNRGTVDIAQTAGQFWPYQGMGADRFHDDTTRLWRNDGRGRFDEVASSAGIAPTRKGKGLAIVDLNNDGFEDIAVAENSGRLRLFRNLAKPADNRWIEVLPVGSKSNRDGVGSVVTVTAFQDAKPQYKEVIGGAQFLGQSKRSLHFGLGPETRKVKEVTIDWPVSGCRQVEADVPVNSRIELREADCLANRDPAST